MTTRLLLATFHLLLVVPAWANPFSDADAERKAAEEAETRQDWSAALSHYENLFDATPTDEGTRGGLRAKFIELRPKVAPNTDPAKAGVFVVRAYAFRNLKVVGKDKDGRERNAIHRFRDDEIEAIRTAMTAFANEVWTNTLGSLRIQWDLKVIDEPLTSWSGWPDPWNCMPHFTDLKDGQVDSIFVYAKSRRSDEQKDPATEDLDWSLWAGTFGVLPNTKSATYIGFNNPGPANGILQLHEWLHAAQWTLQDHQGYPSGLMITSDCGGNCGYNDGRPCYAGPRPDPKEEWMPMYRHLTQIHATRRMWRELSVIRRPSNCWIDQYCRDFLVLGPFPAWGKAEMGLTTPFIDESAVIPSRGQKAGELAWKQIVTPGRNLDLAKAVGPADSAVAYAAFAVRSPRRQFAQLRLGTDDGCRVWLNGQPILHAPVDRAAAADQNIVDIRLNAGINRILIKVANRNGGWEAVARITDLEGQPIPNVQYVPSR